MNTNKYIYSVVLDGGYIREDTSHRTSPMLVIYERASYEPRFANTPAISFPASENNDLFTIERFMPFRAQGFCYRLVQTTGNKDRNYDIHPRLGKKIFDNWNRDDRRKPAGEYRNERRELMYRIMDSGMVKHSQLMFFMDNSKAEEWDEFYKENYRYTWGELSETDAHLSVYLEAVDALNNAMVGNMEFIDVSDIDNSLEAFDIPAVYPDENEIKEILKETGDEDKFQENFDSQYYWYGESTFDKEQKYLVDYEGILDATNRWVTDVKVETIRDHYDAQYFRLDFNSWYGEVLLETIARKKRTPEVPAETIYSQVCADGIRGVEDIVKNTHCMNVYSYSYSVASEMRHVCQHCRGTGRI